MTSDSPFPVISSVTSAVVLSTFDSITAIGRFEEVDRYIEFQGGGVLLQETGEYLLLES